MIDFQWFLETIIIANGIDFHVLQPFLVPVFSISYSTNDIVFFEFHSMNVFLLKKLIYRFISFPSLFNSAFLIGENLIDFKFFIEVVEYFSCFIMKNPDFPAIFSKFFIHYFNRMINKLQMT